MPDIALPPTSPLAGFVSALQAISPGNLRALWLPNRSDTTVTTSPGFGPRAWTFDATIAARITPQGRGILVTFNGTDQYATTPDTADLSFGNGTVDTPFSTVALANVTDTATQRTFLSKFTTNAREYAFYVTTADKLRLELFDESSDGDPFRTSDLAITQGSLCVFGATYSAATGGATAASDITLYQNGLAIASTATNDAGYVAMEDLTSLLELGRATTGYASGSMGFDAIYAAALSAAQHAAIVVAVNNYYGTAI